MFSDKFEPAEKLYFHDRIIDKVFLTFIPRFVKPNHITLFRLAATPIVTALMLYDNYSIGFAAFLFLAFTDAIDGSLARIRNQITLWGKIYDPVADKILISSMIFVIVLRFIDIWTGLVIIGIEMVIVFVAWFRKKRGYKIQANVWGKIKMILQVVGVSVLLIAVINNWAELLPFASGALYMAIVFAIISLLTYGI